MSNNHRITDGNSLYYIYATLRKLRCIQVAELRGVKQRRSAQTVEAKTWETKLFPRSFLLKLLNEKLRDLDELAEELVATLFKRIGKQQPKREVFSEGKESANKKIATINLPTPAKCSELDGYFHHALYYLYDFFIELDWYESDLSKLSKSEGHFVKSELKHMDAFLTFQGALLDNIAPKRVEARKTPKSPYRRSARSPISDLDGPRLGIKSSLSSGISSTQAQTRHVRFRDDHDDLDRADAISSSSSGGSISEILADNRGINKRLKRDIRQSQSILALELLLFALNLFAQRLCNHLSDWNTSSSNNFDAALKLVMNSRTKIRTGQLRTISKQIKVSNDVYMSVLDHLFELKKVYLNDYLLGVLCARNSERILASFKRPRVQTFIKRIGLDAEREIIARLATQCLQILLDLIINEINLPPVELDMETKSKSREELVRSRENYFNFIASWLNVDDVVFGFIKPRAKKPAESSKNAPRDRNDSKADKEAPNNSNLAQGGPQFKSSSRILAQMENLDELARDLMGKVVERLHFDQQQLRHFLELVHVGLDGSFDPLARQLGHQLSVASGANKRPNDGLPTDRATGANPSVELSAVMQSIDLIAAKIRCLKFIHIMWSLARLVRELAAGSKIALKERPLERKLAKFTNDCTDRTGSTFS